MNESVLCDRTTSVHQHCPNWRLYS